MYGGTRRWLVGALVAGTLSLPGAVVATPAVGAAEAAAAPATGSERLLPFPSDTFTVADPTTPTGRRVHFTPEVMPRNAAGVPIDPTEWNRNDGFSPGTPILARVPGVDLEETGAPRETDVAASLDEDSPIVLLDTRTGERHPFWSELDAHATGDRQALIIRPAVNLEEGTRYVVALRNMRNGDGDVIRPSAAFARALEPPAWRWRGSAGQDPRLQRVLADLKQAGVEKGGLYLAWDFTVASAENTTGRMLHIRDDAFAELGDDAPRFTVTEVVDLTPEEDANILRRVVGTFEVPSYLDQPGGPTGSKFHYDDPSADALPARLPGNVQTADFVCNVPRAAVAEPAQPALYGHGLFGRPTEINAGNVRAMSNEHDFLFCATSWIGMSNADVPTALTILQDLTRFPQLTDRVQQGMLDFLFLGRLLIHPEGFAAHDVFRTAEGRPYLDIAKGLVYDGNSQGGIIGGALTAVAQDFTRAVLGVPGMNYSTLLHRSVDFEPFFAVMNGTYPDKLDQQLIFGLLQMLWDRAEANGYAHHMTTDPLPGTPPHQVLLHVAFGDHQVANVTAEVEARTIGASIHTPVLAPGRSPEVDPWWGIPGIESYPFTGSAVVVWDDGTPAPPTANVPPTAGEDPHGVPRAQPNARQQKATFLTTGQVIDVCGGGPCIVPPEAG